MENISRKQPSVQLCWFCQNATNNGCSWSRSFKPVKGWTADRSVWVDSQTTGKIIIDTYSIKACPEFIPDADRKESKRGNKR